jgi:hypothetical protein
MVNVAFRLSASAPFVVVFFFSLNTVSLVKEFKGIEMRLSVLTFVKRLSGWPTAIIENLSTFFKVSLFVSS